MSRSPLFRAIRRALEISSIEPEQTEIVRCAFESGPRPDPLKIDRRSFIAGAAAAAALPLLPCREAQAAVSRRAQPRIAIIGGGIAGLSCAYRLKRHGFTSTIIEGNNRIGGRMFSLRNEFPNGQTAEWGGEFVDSGHKAVRGLCAEMGLVLDDLFGGSERSFHHEIFFVNGRVLTEAQLVEGFRPLAAEMKKAVKRSDSDEAYFAELDAMGILQWIDSTGVANADIRALLGEAYTEEYGLEADEQSVFNLLYLIDYDHPGPFRIFGDSNERFHIRGGNDRLPRKLADILHRQIETGSLLTSVRKNASGKFLVEVQRNSSFEERTFDIVVFALPFTLLRQVNLSAAGLPAWKIKLINELGYGTNAKLFMGFDSKPWENRNSNGSAISTNGLQTCWESTRKQTGSTAILTVFQGGAAGLALGQGTPESLAQGFLPLLSEFFSGVTEAYRADSARRFFWPSSPFALGSYACYKRGQSSFYGLEGQPVGNLYFCGEHCSVNFQGYMEGGCGTGLSTASRIIRKVWKQRDDTIAA